MKHQSNITYYVNEDKRTVVAKLTNVRFELWLMLRDIKFGKYQLPYAATFYWEDNPLLKKIPDEIIGKAVCSPLDEFDEEVGRTIAQARLLKQVYTYRNQVIYEIIANLNGLISKLGSIADFNYDRYGFYDDVIIANYGQFDYNDDDEYYEDDYEDEDSEPDKLV